MAQGLQLSQRLTQSLVLAPQLQQSLALLQAPTLELKALVEQELQQNPVLEEATEAEAESAEKENDSEKDAAADPSEPPADLDFDPAAEKNQAEPVDDFQAEFDRLVQLDQEWRDHFAQTNLPIRASAEEEEKRQFMFDSLVAGTSLQEMLLGQVRESALVEEQWPVAEMLIGNIDEYGYLKASIEELAASTGLATDKIVDVLRVIQTFDPVGVGARDLRECLLLQLERGGEKAGKQHSHHGDHCRCRGRGQGAPTCSIFRRRSTDQYASGRLIDALRGSQGDALGTHGIGAAGGEA